MDKSLQALCDSLKRIFAQLKPQQNPLSFLLLIGKTGQGKTTLLKQSNLFHLEIEQEHPIHVFYNNHGVIVELGESWLNRSENLLAFSLKQLNRCHSNIKISGLVLCVDSSELLLTEPVQLMEQCKSHTQLLERFGNELGYRADTAIFVTKLDALAGFCEFFQAEHTSELNKPFGFSLNNNLRKDRFINHYKTQFDHMLEVTGQQIINKLHPARSSVKRTLIREFPLQLASLRVPLQILLQNLNHHLFHLQALYFTSAEQGGLSVDKLNKKIQHEYALAVQDRFPQSNNYRAYFIEGAIKAFQDQTKHHSPSMSTTHKAIAGVAAGFAGLFLCVLGYQHITTSKLLDGASKELLAYETLIVQPDNKTSAIHHLSQAENMLDLIPVNLFSSSLIEQLKSQLHKNTKHHLQDNFLPDLIGNLEEVISNPSQTQLARYKALKVYLMLGESEHFSEPEVINWFHESWKAKNPDKPIEKDLLLLKKAIKLPLQPIAINRQLISDTRNYLNALPAAYLYYSLAKGSFPQEKTLINIEGFDLTNKELPIYYTKEGFSQIMALLPKITTQLQLDNWILARQDLGNLYLQLQQAYCFEYVTWWQNFIRRTHPQHYQGYQQARQLAQTLQQTNAISHLIELIQQHTSPDLSNNALLFNQEIASQFTALNLMSHSSIKELNTNITELEKFLTTLGVVNDHGRTVFELTRARFNDESQSDPLSALYRLSRQLPEPVSGWAKQIADDTWYIFITESREYLNRKWQATVYNEYQSAISNRYPFEPNQPVEISLAEFDRFFAPKGTLNNFVNHYVKPFLDVSKPQWQPKEHDGYIMPISNDIINELIRANVISNMFFPENSSKSKIDFTLQKINLDPVVASLQLTIGDIKLTDNQDSESYTFFNWPQSNARLALYSIEGAHYELEESGPWAFFKILQKVNVLVDNNDSASLQILFEVNGNSGRYILKTQNPINPFSPGVLTGFNLNKEIT
ncbi:type IVB secretion system protein IcmF [Legionella spiritensis]|uniref:type IVB secretion system protein IcmF n=1 Tax=Legionella spiritensis TaxID=452 RepID=UPI000F6F6971|nr:type IVB secretion system protein IcmF [Legionella spiritensis]VEG90781.1 IcmF [Legionella spiritensis]